MLIKYNLNVFLNKNKKFLNLTIKHTKKFQLLLDI